MAASPDRDRLLVFNCHEAWVHQLSALDAELDIVVGLPGHHHGGWDSRMRPQPPRSRLLGLAEVQASGGAYDCIIAHNLTDLLDVKALPGPRLLVLHSTYEGRIASEGATVEAGQLKATLRRYLDLVGGHAIAVSAMKAQDGFPTQVVTAGVNVEDYPPHNGKKPAGLRIANHVTQKRTVLAWDLHEAAFAGLPVTLVGHNPDRPGVEPARDWAHLKALLSQHRFYIHTADPRYEDGFNMALLEAMAAGLPVIGNRHPTSPIEHGVTGYLADEPAALRSYAERLLAEPAHACEMGAAARDAVARLFPLSKFADGLSHAIETAKRRWRERETRAASVA